jgi:hypothetical protein
MGLMNCPHPEVPCAARPLRSHNADPANRRFPDSLGKRGPRGKGLKSLDSRFRGNDE